MKNLTNIEKSTCYGVQYVGYSIDGTWHITGRSGNWTARKVVGPIAGRMKLFVGYETLRELSQELMSLKDGE